MVLSNTLKSAHSSNSISIFLVDDDSVFLKSLEYHLQHRLKYIYKIKSFLKGEECLESLNQKPDIVILDYRLDGNDPQAKNGIEILKKIKDVNPETEVIMLSGHEKTDVAIETIKNGAYDYIIKNENVFMKIQCTLRNVINSIKSRRQIKTYTNLAKVFITAIVIVSTIILIMKWLVLIK